MEPIIIKNTVIRGKRHKSWLNWPGKASFGVVVQHNGILQELEGIWNGCCGTPSVLHHDGERVGGHLICAVFSRPAGDLFSEILPAKTRT